jgi:hypothetical protein
MQLKTWVPVVKTTTNFVPWTWTQAVQLGSVYPVCTMVQGVTVVMPPAVNAVNLLVAATTDAWVKSGPAA